MRRLVAGVVVLLPSLLVAAEPHVMVVGVWPNRLQFLDEETFEVVGELGLRNGAVVYDTGGYTKTTHSSDFSRLYFITGTMETLELLDEKTLNGDAMFAPFLIPRRLIERASQ